MYMCVCMCARMNVLLYVCTCMSVCHVCKCVSLFLCLSLYTHECMFNPAWLVSFIVVHVRMCVTRLIVFIYKSCIPTTYVWCKHIEGFAWPVDLMASVVSVNNSSSHTRFHSSQLIDLCILSSDHNDSACRSVLKFTYHGRSSQLHLYTSRARHLNTTALSLTLETL